MPFRARSQRFSALVRRPLRLLLSALPLGDDSELRASQVGVPGDPAALTTAFYGLAQSEAECRAVGGARAPSVGGSGAPHSNHVSALDRHAASVHVAVFV
jgi:hypothetical protein